MIDTMPFQPVSKEGKFTSVSCACTCTSFNFCIVWEGEVKKKSRFEKHKDGKKTLDSNIALP